MLHARTDYDRIQDPAGRIPEDEPVFLVRGQDVLAPMVLEFYAKIAAAYGAPDEIIGAVEDHALRMRAWQLREASKAPDMPEGARRALEL